MHSTSSTGVAPLRSSDERQLRIHGSVARNLGIRILSGAHAPGDLLDNEIEASGQLHVSRTAYREAVRILAAKGLVQPRPRIGTKVSPRSDWNLLDADVLEWMFHHDPDPKLLADLFELRRLIEPEAASLAAARRTDEHLQRMSEALDRMRSHTLETPEGREADQGFHAAMTDAADNHFLASLTSGIEAAVSWSTQFKRRRLPVLRDPIPEHLRVFEAIRDADQQGARSAMADLVEQAWRDTVEVDQA